MRAFFEQIALKACGRAIAALACLAFFLCGVRPAWGRLADPYKIEADYIIFSIDTKVISCIDNVTFNYRTLTILADHLSMDLDKDYVVADGRVMISNGPIDLRVADDDEEEALLYARTATDTADLEASLLGQGLGQPVNPVVSEEQDDKEFHQLYQGESLIFDMRNLSVALFQTQNRVRRINLRGEDLREVDYLVDFREGFQIVNDPLDSKGNITATRMKVSPGNKYEAWNSSIFIEGNKILSLPYWTNTGKGIIPGSFKLRKVRYSSNQNWFVSTQYRYSEKDRKKGFFNLSYAGDGRPTYLLSLEQQLTLKRNTSFQVSLSELGTGSLRHSVSMFRQLKGRKSLRLGYSDQIGEANSLRLSFDGIVKQTSYRFSYYRNKNKRGNGQPGSISTNMDLGLNARPKYLDGKRKFTLTINGDASYSSQNGLDYDDLRTAAYFSILRSGGWALAPKTRLNADGSFNTSRTFAFGSGRDDSQNSDYGLRLRLSRDIGRDKQLSFSYSQGESRSGGANKSHRQRLTAALNLSKRPLWNLRLSSSYNFYTETLTSAGYSLDYKFNKRFTMSTVGSWDMLENDVKNVNYTANYDLHGVLVNLNWYAEENDFIIDVASPVR